MDELNWHPDQGPLGSKKARLNAACKESFTDIDIVKLFGSAQNIRYLSNSLFNSATHLSCTEQSGKLRYEWFLAKVPQWMMEFKAAVNIKGYAMAEDPYMPWKVNWTEVLRVVNADFVRFARKYLPDDRQQKKCVVVRGELKNYSSLSVEDIGAIDVWRNQTVRVQNNNQIPLWRGLQTVRHIDRTLDGLAGKEIASRESSVRHTADYSAMPLNTQHGSLHHTRESWCDY